MIKLTFTDEDIQQLHYERCHHPHPRVQRKMEALYLKRKGYPHWEICPLIQVSESTLLSYFREHPPKTLAQATAKIAELTGINRSREQVRHFLKSIGMSCRRVGVLPAKADVAAQEDFLKKN